MDRKRVGILVFPDVEVLDFCGPFEVFSVTRLNEERRREEPSPFEPVLVAERKDVVTATGGLKVVPDYSIDDCPPLALLVVPGGWGTRTEIKNRRLLEWIAKRAREVGRLGDRRMAELVLRPPEVSAGVQEPRGERVAGRV